MFRTVFSIGLVAIVGLFFLKLAFGIFGAFFALLLMLVWWAIRIAIIGAVIYLLIRIFSPETARRMRERWAGK
ncbi:MAG: hypothetical protein ACT4R6_10945 [Gemmatimonadaceae bacterium]